MWLPCLDLYLTFHERVLGLLVFIFDGSTEIGARFYRKVLRKISLRRFLFVKTFMLIFTDIRMLTSSCLFFTPTIGWHVFFFVIYILVYEYVDLWRSLWIWGV